MKPQRRESRGQLSRHLAMDKSGAEGKHSMHSIRGNAVRGGGGGGDDARRPRKGEAS